MRELYALWTGSGATRVIDCCREVFVWFPSPRLLVKCIQFLIGLRANDKSMLGCDASK